MFSFLYRLSICTAVVLFSTFQIQSAQAQSPEHKSSTVGGARKQSGGEWSPETSSRNPGRSVKPAKKQNKSRSATRSRHAGGSRYLRGNQVSPEARSSTAGGAGKGKRRGDGSTHQTRSSRPTR